MRKVPTEPGQQEGLQGGEAAPGDASFRAPAQPRASVLHREETRVEYAGAFQVHEVPALRLSGFRRSGLNQAYVKQPELQMGGLPTWWSEDGRYFIYFAEEYRHWKVNALRSGGGDGMRAVRPGGLRAGRGFAHSGALGLGPERSTRTAALEALCHAEGWFEVSAGEWEPLQPELSAARAWALELDASSMSSEELLACGEDSSRERRSGGPCRLRGLRFTGATGGRVALFLPAVSGALEEELVFPAQAAGDQTPEDGEAEEDVGPGASGDPDVLLLEPLRESRL
uniref:Uncharacterized protein n=1 Tax=Alexandrium monilatum TaxID=311494 RepID=A0A7S4Q8C4_9DINO